jgi:hypothetical protein
VGTGYANTQAAVGQAGGGNTAGHAITAAWDYTNNSKSDWHLPSKDELNQLYLRRTTVGGFATDFYWSSSEGIAAVAWDQDFYFGNQIGTSKADYGRVRPVRAF